METDRLFQLIPAILPGAGRQASIATLGSIRRLDSLFRAMATDYLLREQFVTGPSSVIFEYVYGIHLSPQQAQVSDQLIYAVMSSRRLLEWLYDRASEALEVDVSDARNAYANQFARGVVEQGSHQVLVAMLRSSSEGQHPVGLDEILLAVLTPSLKPVGPPSEGGGGDGGDGGGDGGDGGDGGTGDGGGGTGDGGTADGGTADGGGTLTAITLTTFITNPQPPPPPPTSPFTHTGITRTPFTQDRPEAMFDPAYVILSMDALFQYSNVLRERGALDQAFHK